MIGSAWLPRAERCDSPLTTAQSTPRQEIRSFLAASGTDPDAALNVAMEFARRMCDELRTTLAQWEGEMEILQETQAVAAAAAGN